MIKFCNKRLTASKTFKERANITEPENRTRTLEQNHKKTQISTAKTKNKSHWQTVLWLGDRLQFSLNLEPQTPRRRWFDSRSRKIWVGSLFYFILIAVGWLSLETKWRESNLDLSLTKFINWVANHVNIFILLHEKFLQFDWLRAVVFQLNLKYLRVKITNLWCVVV